jgi:hypothetical protein
MLGYIQAIGHCLRLLSPALSSFVMERNLFVPFWVGITCFASSLPLISALPDTRRDGKPKDQSENDSSRPASGEAGESLHENEETALISSVENVEYDDSVRPTSHDKALEQPGFVKIGRQFYQDLETLFSLLISNRNIALIFCATSLNTLGRCLLTVLAQYISYRYSWTFAKVLHHPALHSLANGLHEII